VGEVIAHLLLDSPGSTGKPQYLPFSSVRAADLPAEAAENDRVFLLYCRVQRIEFIPESKIPDIFLQYALSYGLSGIPYELFAEFDFGEKMGDFAKNLLAVHRQKTYSARPAKK